MAAPRTGSDVSDHHLRSAAVGSVGHRSAGDLQRWYAPVKALIDEIGQEEKRTSNTRHAEQAD